MAIRIDKNYSGIIEMADVLFNEETKKEETNNKLWARSGDEFYAVESSTKVLPSGIYTPERCNGKYLLSRKDFSTDSMEDIIDTNTDIIDSFVKFWDISEEYSKKGFLHKRGYMFMGSAGCGKSFIINRMILHTINLGGAVFSGGYPGEYPRVMSDFREIQPTAPLLIVLEDIDGIIKRYGEEELLELMDGSAQVNHTVFVASTNYPENVPDRFRDRPSRFDAVHFIDLPNEEIRRKFIVKKVPTLLGEDVDHWVEVSEGFSMAHVKEMIISVTCYEQPLKEVVERLNKVKSQKYDSENFKKKEPIGFIDAIAKKV